MEKDELSGLIDNLRRVDHKVPDNLYSRKDALACAILDLELTCRHGAKSKDYQKAVDFARSVPVFEDLDGDKFIAWLNQDQELWKYYISI